MGNPLGSQPESPEWTMNLDGFNGIGRTGGNVPAGCRGIRGNGIFIDINRNKNNPA